MVRTRDRGSGGDHIGVANRPNLLEPVAPDQPVEDGEDLVENGDGGGWRLVRGPDSEPGEVSEEHRNLVVMVSDWLFAPLEARRYRFGEDVQQQRLRPLLGDVALRPEIDQPDERE